MSLPIIGQMFDRAPGALTALREQSAVAGTPTHAQLYVINKCNLKCQHCYESEDTHPTEKMMSLAEIEDVLDQLAELGVLRLTITGGEIFLRRDILEIVAAARKRRFFVTLFTSGYQITEKKADALAALLKGAGQVDISVYSDRAEDHDAFTQIPGSWQRSTNALKFLAERGVGVALKCVLTRFNVDRIDHVIALAQSLGADFQFDPNVRPRMNNDEDTLQFALSPEELHAKVYSRRDLYPGYQRVSPDTICRGESWLHGESAMCGAGSTTLAIGALGEVYPCGFFPEPVGHLKTRKLREIWERSAVMDDVRQMTYDKMSGCSACDLKSACHPCMAYGQVEHDDYKACNTASRVSAEALMRMSELGARANAKFARAGRALPIVGDTSLPPVDGRSRAVLTMFD